MTGWVIAGDFAFFIILVSVCPGLFLKIFQFCQAAFNFAVNATFRVLAISITFTCGQAGEQVHGVIDIVIGVDMELSLATGRGDILP